MHDPLAFILGTAGLTLATSWLGTYILPTINHPLAKRATTWLGL